MEQSEVVCIIVTRNNLMWQRILSWSANSFCSASDPCGKMMRVVAGRRISLAAWMTCNHSFCKEVGVQALL